MLLPIFELLVKLSVYHCLPLPTGYPLSLFNACEAWIIGPPVTVSGGGGLMSGSRVHGI